MTGRNGTKAVGVSTKLTSMQSTGNGCQESETVLGRDDKRSMPRSNDLTTYAGLIKHIPATKISSTTPSQEHGQPRIS
jgi:hypothetical protein